MVRLFTHTSLSFASEITSVLRLNYCLLLFSHSTLFISSSSQLYQRMRRFNFIRSCQRGHCACFNGVLLRLPLYVPFYYLLFLLLFFDYFTLAVASAVYLTYCTYDFASFLPTQCLLHYQLQACVFCLRDLCVCQKAIYNVAILAALLFDCETCRVQDISFDFEFDDSLYHPRTCLTRC